MLHVPTTDHDHNQSEVIKRILTFIFPMETHIRRCKRCINSGIRVNIPTDFSIRRLHFYHNISFYLCTKTKFNLWCLKWTKKLFFGMVVHSKDVVRSGTISGYNYFKRVLTSSSSQNCLMLTWYHDLFLHAENIWKVSNEIFSYQIGTYFMRGHVAGGMIGFIDVNILSSA